MRPRERVLFPGRQFLIATLAVPRGDAANVSATAVVPLKPEVVPVPNTFPSHEGPDRRDSGDRRSGDDRRGGADRRQNSDPHYTGPERRSGVDRRVQGDRRAGPDRRQTP